MRFRISICIPAYNGMPFIASVISRTLQNLDYRDELIVSTGKSADGLSTWLNTVSHKRLRVVEPVVPGLSMAEHWDWMATFAEGEWQMFLGQDDLLFKNYSETVDRLLARANHEKVRIVGSPRAFLYWPSPTSHGRLVKPSVKGDSLRNLGRERFLAMVGLRAYHSMPTSYTSSLVHSSLVTELRNKQDGKLLIAHPQDASLAASFSEIENRYLRSGVPFSWVGTSSRSAGWDVAERAYSTEGPRGLSTGAAHLRTISTSELRYPFFAGFFGFAENTIYFFQAVVAAKHAQGHAVSDLWMRAGFMVAASGCFLRVKPFSKRFLEKRRALLAVAKRNGIPRIFGDISFFVATLGYPFLVIIRAIRTATSIRRHSSTSTSSQFDGSEPISPFAELDSTEYQMVVTRGADSE